MLRVAAFQLRDPITVFILVEAGDPAFSGWSIRETQSPPYALRLDTIYAFPIA